MNWWKGLKGRISFNAPLKKYAFFKAGGPAKIFIEPEDIGDLKRAVRLLKKERTPFLVLGRGSNILVSDKGVNKAVFRLSAPAFTEIKQDGVFIEAGAGVLLSKIILFSQTSGLSAAEFLAGIPGTLGGALSMNAGAWGKCIGDLVEEVNVMDSRGKIKKLKKEEIKFGYRHSGLSKYVILSGRLKLARKNKAGIASRIKKYISERKDKQDLSYPSLGSTFKNPDGYPAAGRLIDLCGIKGRRIGGACISNKHANFILNLKNAKSADVLKLMDLMKHEVKNKFGITLKPEIKIWQ